MTTTTPGARSDGSYDGSYDEALERLHRTGPEFDGWLSNHGPMVVEALGRRGSGRAVHRWTDGYLRRLEDLPASTGRLDAARWEQSLGDATRLGDWLDLFDRELRDRPWDDVLLTWWPRLLPGIAAGATHGVIRTGHAVQALRSGVTGPRVAELGQALGYWAARWQPVPVPVPAGDALAADLVRDVPRVADQSGGVRERLAQLPDVAQWPGTVSALRPPADAAAVPGALAAVVDAVVLAYPAVAHGQPTMLVHAATAPAAVARALPSLPDDRWVPAFRTAWAASCAVLAAYLPAPDDRPDPAPPVDDPWSAALDDGSEHVLKLADVALDTARRLGGDAAAAAVAAAVRLGA